MLQSENKRIVQNALVLYVRMFFTMGISLFTTRIVLDALGIIDFGIYNVVGGIVAMFGIFSKTLATTTQRFLNFSSGHNELEESQKTFSTSLLIHILFALVILTLGETIGLKFLLDKINVPKDRLEASIWVFHLSLLTGVINILQIPYTALIIANEKMKVYAYVGVFEAVLKLAVASSLYFSCLDKLISFSLYLLLAHTVIYYSFYKVSRYKFAESRFSFVWDKKLLSDMITYSGWNTVSGLANLLSKEGVNILLNIFFGPILNAARSLSLQVNNAVRIFANNLQIAANPQIVKLYAANRHQDMFHLIINNARYAFLLMALMGIPFIVEIDFILKLWLKEVPSTTSTFCRLLLCQSVLLSVHLPLGMGIHAHGKMRIPNLTASIVYLSIVPITYLLFKSDFPSYSPFILMVLIEPVTIVVDLYLLNKFINFPILDYFNMLMHSMLLVAISMVLPLFFFLTMDFGWLRFVLVVLSAVLSLSYSVYKYALSEDIKHKLLRKFILTIRKS